MFDERLQVVITAISESGIVDLNAFKESEEYEYIKDLFEVTFLGNQLFESDHAA
ncbi:hypothetical protein ACHABW_16065 [Salipaludibacillus sp. CF4.18]